MFSPCGSDTPIQKTPKSRTHTYLCQHSQLEQKSALLTYKFACRDTLELNIRFATSCMCILRVHV